MKIPNQRVTPSLVERTLGFSRFEGNHMGFMPDPYYVGSIVYKKTKNTKCIFSQFHRREVYFPEVVSERPGDEFDNYTNPSIRKR